MSRRVIHHELLEKFAYNVFHSLKFSEKDALLVARALVKANLRGQDGHGVARIPMYAKRIRCGLVNPSAVPSFTNITPVVIACDGDNGMGFVVAHEAMNRAIAVAEVLGLAMVGVRNSTHFGSSAEYVQQAIDSNMMSMVFTNSSPALPPWGGRKAWLGSSPIGA